MKNKLYLMLGTLLISGTSLAQDDSVSTVGFSSQNSGTNLIFDVAGSKNKNVIGIRGDLPLDETSRAVEAMNQRWHKKPSTNIEFYGTVDIGYQHISN